MHSFKLRMAGGGPLLNAPGGPWESLPGLLLSLLWAQIFAHAAYIPGGFGPFSFSLVNLCSDMLLLPLCPPPRLIKFMAK